MWRYTMHAETHARELEDEAAEIYGDDDGDLDGAVSAALGTMTFSEWMGWCAAYADEVRALSRATPSARRRRKTKPGILVYLAAYQLCRAAAALMELGEHIGPGGGYRETTAYAGHQAAEIANKVLRIRAEGFTEAPLPFADHGRRSRRRP